MESWLDGAGRIAGYGHARERWLHLTGIGTFTFTGSVMEVCAHPDVPEDVIRDAHHRLAMPLVLAALGRRVLHASSVLTSRGAAALCAASGVGKSTLAYGLVRRGLRACGDDAVALEPSSAGPRLVALPFELRLLPESRAHFSLNGNPVKQTGTLGGSWPLAAVCVMERGRGEGPGVEPLPANAAFPALLAHAYDFGFADDDLRRSMLEGYLALAAAVPVLKVTLPEGLAALDDTLDSIERALSSAGT